MASQDLRLAKLSRRQKLYRGLVVGLISLVGGWSALWYYVRHQAETEVSHLMAEWVSSGLVIQCDDLSYGGYPFHLVLSCRDGHLSARAANQQAFDLTFEQAEAYALIYMPDRFQIGFAGPLAFDIAGAGHFVLSHETLAFSIKGGKTDADVRIQGRKLALSGSPLSLFPGRKPQPMNSTLDDLLVNVFIKASNDAYQDPDLQGDPAMAIDLRALVNGLSLFEGAPSLSWESAGRFGPFWPTFIESPALFSKAKTRLVFERFDFLFDRDNRVHSEGDFGLGAEGHIEGTGKLVINDTIAFAKTASGLSPLLGIGLLSLQALGDSAGKGVSLPVKAGEGRLEVGNKSFPIPALRP